MNKTWVVDSSALIILGKLSLLDILPPQLCDNLIIPEGVAKEILNGPDEDMAKSWLKKDGKKYQKNIGPISLNIASWDLGAGETKVLSHCRWNTQNAAIIDDRAAKKCAETFSIKVKGTLAIIMSAKKAGLISEVKPILDRMLEFRFRIKSTLYKKILEIVNE
ncbi:MAG: DUF3368 domain-containing protein [Candidatus Aminicenantes bacterium]|nr:MAG: DUF3368 domain-containing protein [Candidatus Aminicenantes bacterium]